MLFQSVFERIMAIIVLPKTLLLPTGRYPNFCPCFTIPASGTVEIPFYRMVESSPRQVGDFCILTVQGEEEEH